MKLKMKMIKKKGQQGQTFVEFILLFLFVTTLSLVLLQQVSGGISKRWKSMIEVISTPTDTEIEFP